MKVVGAAVLGLIALVGLGWFFTANDYAMFKFWAPKYENVKRQVFEQTKSYQRGTEQDLRQDMREMVRESDPQKKQALESMFLHELDGYDQPLPPDIQAEADQLRGETH